MGKLERMYNAQRSLQVDAFGGDPADLSDEERIQFIKDMVLALSDELHEALNEVGWKPWASSRHINEEAFKGELVDAFHFFMNLMLVVDFNPDQLFERYMKKRQKNIDRQTEGYDGVAGKCPICKRALDDDGVTCYTADAEGFGFCAKVGKVHDL